jgi:hypothetical protein
MWHLRAADLVHAIFLSFYPPCADQFCLDIISAYVSSFSKTSLLSEVTGSLATAVPFSCQSASFPMASRYHAVIVYQRGEGDEHTLFSQRDSDMRF